MDALAPRPPLPINARLIEPLRGAAALGYRSHREWHLVIVRQPGWQSAEDWDRIASHVRDIDPRIAVFLVRRDVIHSYARRQAAGRPTLVFSPGPLEAFRPLRGRVYEGRPIAKLEQVERLAAAGVPVPRTAMLTPDLVLDPAVWGEFVIVKPTDLVRSSHGHGVKLMRTSRVRFKPTSDYPPDHPGHYGPMLVQQFIDTGDHISHYRALTLFGEPLYIDRDRAIAPRADLAAADEEIERTTIATQGIEKEKWLVEDPDVIAIARAAHAAIPEVPLKGCDILREAHTGALYVLEVNAGGNTWHFSSDQLARRRRLNGPEFERRRLQQFDALRTAARLLVEKTHAEAE